MTKQRHFKNIPILVILLFLIGLMLQIIWQLNNFKKNSKYQPLPDAPSQNILNLQSFGDNIVLSRLLILWLQSHTSQNGLYLSNNDINYKYLTDWLNAILQQDSHTQYPLFLASYQYILVKHPQKQRQVLEFIHQQFYIDPKRRWRWLAQAAVIAKYRLQDLPLALKYAEILTAYAPIIPDMPDWAKEMQIFILEDMGELAQARLLIGGLLTNGLITDPDEVAFLNEKLQALEQAQSGLQE
ncbi:hypothetical protein [Candidatus Albibeggiatoa sp. nov. NOAA]|uniref:hypothetical protein n=1 Tax=Candidatus Albibeggiatoa sp. nov. NOAA TaxID=3162724 RepID=UPI0032F634FC|nr:hypothetical protein [Thiotrichaceae bacterium]